MRYPDRAEIQLARDHGTAAGVIARRYGLTIAEVIEIDHRGAVKASTAEWADRLRAKYPEKFNARP